MKKELALMNAVGVFNHVAAITPNQHIQLTNSDCLLQVVIFCDNNERLAYRVKKGLEDMLLESATIEVTYIPWHERRDSTEDLYYVNIDWDFEK